MYSHFIVRLGWSSNPREREKMGENSEGRKESTLTLAHHLSPTPRSPKGEGGKKGSGCDQLRSPSRMANTARCRSLPRRGWQQRRPPRRLRREGGRSCIHHHRCTATNISLAHPPRFTSTAEFTTLTLTGGRVFE